MNGQPQAPQSENSALNAFGKAIGFIVALLTTMPIYHSTYAYFYRYALSYSHVDYRSLFEMVYLGSLFIAITVTAWFVLSMMLGLVKTLLRLFALFFTLLWR